MFGSGLVLLDTFGERGTLIASIIKHATLNKLSPPLDDLFHGKALGISPIELYPYSKLPLSEFSIWSNETARLIVQDGEEAR